MVGIISKNKIHNAIICVFPNSKITKIKKLGKGMINENYDLSIRNPKKNLILRVYPKDDWKAKKEEYLYRLVSHKTDVPVPEVYMADTSKKILPNAFILYSKIEGISLGDYYKKTKNKRIIFRAGEILAKIHSIKFPAYGWIMGREIMPKFSRWADFMGYDMEEKVGKLLMIRKIQRKTIRRIADYYNEKKSLLDVKDAPSLLHKDYHFSHIFVDDGKISGIIDMEWAVAGHNELDIAKSKWFMFERFPEIEKPFMNGYKKYGRTSAKFEERANIYRLTLLVGLTGLSYELKDRKWLDYNIRKMEELIR